MFDIGRNQIIKLSSGLERVLTLLETLKSYNLNRMKTKQLVIFTILNNICESIYTIKKKELYDHDKKLFYDVYTNTNN